MIKQQPRKIYLPTLFFLCLFCVNANATTISIVQNYGITGNPDFREDLTNTLLTATLQFDGSSLTGSGTEILSAQSIDLVFSNRNIPGLAQGLSFTASAFFSFPFEPVSSFEAEFIDDSFVSFGLLGNTGGIKFSQFSPDGGGIINLASLASNGGQLSLRTIGNDPRYNLLAIGGSTIFRTSVVPLPAALPMFGTGLALMGFIGWRRKRRGTATT